MDANSINHLPHVLVVAPNPDRREFLEATLSPYFEVTSDADVDRVILADESESARAQVIVIDQNGRTDPNSERYLTHCERLKSKIPGLIATAAPDLSFDLRDVAPKVPARFLRWPIERQDLLEAVSQVIGEKTEHIWREELAEEIGKPLTYTVDEYQHISNAIAAGKPVDCEKAAESCKPLVDAVSTGNHHTLLTAVQSHHNYTYVHSMRVATLLTLFGHGLGMTEDDLLVLSTGGLVHDVGKLVTPAEILDKPGKLTEEEWPIMRDHVLHSTKILGKSNDVNRGVFIIAGQHHEKLDGSGYPNGLKSAELNELARMSAIVDIFGALTDKRSYKPAFPTEKAFGILESMTEQIDQHLLGMFRDIFEPGSEVTQQAA